MVFFSVYASEKETMPRKEQFDSTSEDPLEGLNRAIFSFNTVVDGVLLNPIANTYRGAVPLEVQIRISNVLGNLFEPMTCLNDCLQTKGGKALESFSRFLINSVFGLFGLFDVAEKLGLPKHKETFNATLQKWGVPQGPYIVLPVFGPSCPRFMLGLGVDYFADPFNYYFIHNGKERWLDTRVATQFVVTKADLSADIDTFKKSSIDFYASMRSFFKQYMNAQHNGETVVYESPSLDEFFDE